VGKGRRRRRIDVSQGNRDYRRRRRRRRRRRTCCLPFIT